MGSCPESCRWPLEAIGALGRDTYHHGQDSFEAQPIMFDPSGCEAEHGAK